VKPHTEFVSDSHLSAVFFFSLNGKRKTEKIHFILHVFSAPTSKGHRRMKKCVCVCVCGGGGVFWCVKRGLFPLRLDRPTKTTWAPPAGSTPCCWRRSYVYPAGCVFWGFYISERNVPCNPGDEDLPGLVARPTSLSRL